VTEQDAARLLELSREADFLGPDARTWVNRLRPERQLVDAARSFVENGRSGDAAELAANVWRLWQVTGDPAGGRELLAVALDVDRPEPSRARALALYGDGLFAFRQGTQEDSRRRNEEALEVARAVGDAEAASLALVGLSRVAFREADYDRVRTLAEQARELVRDAGATSNIAPLHMLAAGTRLSGDLDGAVQLYEESLELNRKLGDSRMIAGELHNLGHVELHRGNIGAAQRAFAEADSLRSGDDPYDLAMAQLNQAALAYERGDRSAAAERLRSCQSTLADAGIALDPDDAYEVAWLEERVA